MRTATGSALISMGETRVICTASAEERVPRWLAGSGRAGSPPSTGCSRRPPASASSATSRKGRADGRTVEIQRLIGRALRGVVDFAALGENSIYLDCDVLQADGGTRDGVDHRRLRGARAGLRRARRRRARSPRSPLTGSVAAISCGIVGGVPLLDLDYPEDSSAEVDANVVMTGDGGLVEVQATAERTPLSRARTSTSCWRWPRRASRELRVAQDEAIAAGRRA